MGQQEIYSLLKKYKDRWFSAREIAKFLDASFKTVITNLKRLRKAGIVMYKTVASIVKPAGKRQVYVYKYKK